MFGLVTVFCFNFCQNKVLHVVFSSLNTYYIYLLKPQPVFLCCLIGIPGQLYLGLIGVSRQTQMQQNLQFNRVIKCNSAHCTELRFISFLSTGFTKGQKMSKAIFYWLQSFQKQMKIVKFLPWVRLKESHFIIMIMIFLFAPLQNVEARIEIMTNFCCFFWRN